VIIVADRGINSKVNLKQITDRGYSYIFASRIRKLGKKIEDLIFEPDGYNEFTSEKDGKVRYKVVDYINHVTGEDGKKVALKEKLVITYSDKRAKKDLADRLRLIDKAYALLEEPSRIKAINKRGGKKYLKNSGQETWLLDMEAIAKNERFDGYYAIQTNETELAATEILEAYHTLWKIEESFKIMKSTLEVRPVFHWTESRIKGHFVVCFLAFLLERNLEFKLARANVEGASPEKIREALNSLNFAEVELEGHKLLIKTKGTDLSSKILRVLRMKHPKNVSTPEELVL
ncbi:MAG TPA: IS1634 family transposase, partial [Peptococcaceae bacterium]|nr:IS1634 family transposase [Peptococcaceae bacterium]